MDWRDFLTFVLPYNGRISVRGVNFNGVDPDESTWIRRFDDFDGIQEFLESIEEKYDSMRADIPLPHDVYTLSNIFSKNGLSLFAVGGVIRDYLYSHFHSGKFSPKDVDLATEAPPKKVLEILSNAGINTFPKGEAFGT